MIIHCFKKTIKFELIILALFVFKYVLLIFSVKYRERQIKILYLSPNGKNLNIHQMMNGQIKYIFYIMEYYSAF